MRYFPIIVILLFVVGYVAKDAIYTVDQTQKGLVLQFGEPKGEPVEPGLNVKLPFIQKVAYIDMRLLDYDATAAEILTKDKKNMVVDAFVRWRVKEPLEFYKRFNTDFSANIVEDAKKRLSDIVAGELRSELAKHDMAQIVSAAKDDKPVESQGEPDPSKVDIDVKDVDIIDIDAKELDLASIDDLKKESVTARDWIMTEVTKRSDEKAAEWGMEVVDVRIKRADLPIENQRAVFDRMRTEREQQAKLYRSRGEESAQKIRAEAERKKTVILAEAEQKSQVIRGEGDAQAAEIYANAYGADAEFYVFTRSLESYEKNFSENTTIVVSPEDMDYLKYFGQVEK